MARNTEILSVSITKQQFEWLDMVGESASELIQDKINEKMELWNKFNQEKSKLLANIQGLQKILEERNTYIEEKGLSEEFNKWRGEKYGRI